MSNKRRVRIRSMLASVRQLLYPREFRIAAPNWPDFPGALEDIVSLLQPAPPEVKVSSRKEEDLLNLVVDIGTVIWRLQRRLATGGEVPEQIRRISRDLESAWDVLSQQGIEIKDHTGEKYDGGMALHVIAFQPMAELSQEQVIETIKPTIYHKDKLVRMGEVIVGVPQEDTTPKTPK